MRQVVTALTLIIMLVLHKVGITIGIIAMEIIHSIIEVYKRRQIETIKL